MAASQETDISSFLIRFIDTKEPDRTSGKTYRGMIRHIQSGDEIAFTRWVEATDFLQRFFPLADLDVKTLKGD
jgi:hypothetical protein